MFAATRFCVFAFTCAYFLPKVWADYACITNECLDDGQFYLEVTLRDEAHMIVDIIGICTNSTLTHLSCEEDVCEYRRSAFQRSDADIHTGAGSFCMAVSQSYGHRCHLSFDIVIADSDKCLKDTCDHRFPEKNYLLLRCFAGMTYVTNCNEVLGLPLGGAFCHDGAGRNGAAVCEPVPTNGSSVSRFSSGCNISTPISSVTHKVSDSVDPAGPCEVSIQ